MKLVLTVRGIQYSLKRLLCVAARALCCASVTAVPVFSARAANWSKLACSAISNSGARSYNTSVECVAAITKTGSSQWHNAFRQNCQTFCSSIQGSNVASPDGFWCTSGENRPLSAINAKIDYRPTGCWHPCGQPEGTRGAISVGDRCYSPTQTRDNDLTDLTVGCFCQTGDIGSGILDVGLSSSGNAQARATSPATLSNWQEVGRNTINDSSGRLVNIVGDITVGETASISVSVNIQGACGTTATINGLISQANGVKVSASPYTVDLPACPPQCGDGVDNDGDGRVDSADPDCSGPQDNSEVSEVTTIGQCGDGIDNDGDGAVDALRELNFQNGETFSIGQIPARPGVFDPGIVQAAVLGNIRLKGFKVTPPIDNEARLTRAISLQPLPHFDDGGKFDTQTLNQVCRILGYRTYVSSTCRDSERSGRYPRGKCSYHSPGDNGMWRFVGNDFAREGAFYHTWISSITCRDKLPACDDGWDNDGDGKVDTQDDGCASKNDDNERPHDVSCSTNSNGSESPWTPICVKRANCMTQSISAQAARLDVNRDCLINETDSGLITQHIDSGGVYRSDYDVNGAPDFVGDGLVSTTDVLTITNFTNASCESATPVATNPGSPANPPSSTPASSSIISPTETSRPMATTPAASPTATVVNGATSVVIVTPIATDNTTGTPAAEPAATTAVPNATPTGTAERTPVWPDQVGLIIFVPSLPFDPQASYDGVTGGVKAADAFCQQRAAAGNLVSAQSQWRALISTSTQDAQSLTGSSSSSARIVNRRAELLALNREKLWNASAELVNAPGYDEFGSEVSTTIVTGSDASGIRLEPGFCGDLTSDSSTVSGTGTSSEKSRSWISKLPASSADCSVIRLYCIGNFQSSPSSEMPPINPTNTSLEMPTFSSTLAPTDRSSGTPNSSPTSGSSSGSSGGNGPNSPTTTPTSTMTTGSSSDLPDRTPSPTPTSLPISTSSGGPSQFNGNVEANGKPISGALIYAPELVNLAISLKDGSWNLSDIEKASSNVVLKIRSTQLVNSGVDIPASLVTTLQIRDLQSREYNPNRCAEKDHLLNLYNAALRVRSLWLASYDDHRFLSSSEANTSNRQTSGRALRRAQYHAQTYFELSTLLPDRQLFCSSSQRACPPVSYNRIIRTMRQSTTHLRHESLLFNRRLRFLGARSEAASERRIRSIRSSSKRLIALIQKLPRSSFNCSGPPNSPVKRAPLKPRRSR
jgi:hypothetical protein